LYRILLFLAGYARKYKKEGINMRLKLQEIKKCLKNDGEVRIGDYEIVLDGINEAEVIKNNEYFSTFTNWAELEDFLIEEVLSV
jgi:hypothetical protein